MRHAAVLRLVGVLLAKHVAAVTMDIAGTAGVLLISLPGRLQRLQGCKAPRASGCLQPCPFLAPVLKKQCTVPGNDAS
jgi:hypothetical protein